jgi:hypothetical protein
MCAIGGATTLSPGALASFTATGGPSSAVGKISVTGDLTLNANAITVNVSGAALAAGSYRLMDCTGTLSGSASSVPTITGTPLAGGYTATVASTTGSAGHVDLVVVACPAIALSPTSLPSGTIGAAYSQTLTASGGAAPYTFAVTAGGLPGGLTLSTSGSLSGTPSTIGANTFTVTATDTNGCVGNWGYTLAVVGNPPIITTQLTNQTVLAGTPVTIGVAVTGAGPFSYQWQFDGTNILTYFITTVAGNGTYGFSGDGGAGTNASLYLPGGVALDASGNLYIGDTDNHRIRKVDSNGIITTVAGWTMAGTSMWWTSAITPSARSRLLAPIG